MAATSPYHIASLLDKMSSSDKDFRYMATNDLMSELQKDSIKLDDDRERMVVQSLIRLLEDKNGEVQNLAVKCLGPLVRKVKEQQVEWIVDTLCSNMISSKEQLRDISSIGLKTIINELPVASSPLSSNICKRITSRLTDAIGKNDDQSIQLEALDILGDILSRFGGLLVLFHSALLKCMLPLLTNKRMAIRKRAIVTLSHLMITANSSVFIELMLHLINELQTKNNQADVRTYIHCIGSICRQSGHRVGDHLDRVIPMTISFFADGDDELRETCIQTLESFVCKCPKEVTPYVGKITDLCLEYLCYDPNYNYGEDINDGCSLDTNDDEDFDNEDEDEYSDDDDMSWKIRRAAAKCLGSIMSSRHELLNDFYTWISPRLISRFKEREENVKADIFQTYISLLRQTRTMALGDKTKEINDGPLKLLSEQVPTLIRCIYKQLQEKSVKTRQGCFELLTELVTVLPGALSNHIELIVPGIAFSLNDKNSTSNMKIDTLAFLGFILTKHEPQIFFPHISKLLPAVIVSIKDPFYKIASEALIVAQNAVAVMCLLEKSVYSEYLHDLYKAVFSRLQATDIDQEIKEKSITCMAQILSYMGDSLLMELPSCLPIYLERLQNEITRLTTVKALILIVSSPLKLDLSLLLNDAIPVMSSFLRKNHRGLKLSTLTCLDTFIQNYGGVMSMKHFEAILNELVSLINEGDLHISQLVLCLLTSMITKKKQLMPMIKSNVLPVALHLTRSPLLQGNALKSMLSFLTHFVSSEEIEYQPLIEMLTEVIYHPTSKTSNLVVHKMAFYSIAKCAAAITLACKAQAENTILKLISDIKNTNSSDSICLFALLTIGEIGSSIDLSNNLELKTVIVNSFASECEDIKSAASYALGHLCVGNLTAYLPFILDQIKMNTKRQYLLLHSLKEVITCQSVSQTPSILQPFLPAIWGLLFSHCESKEEGTRNVVAECLGKLTLIDPVNLLEQLQARLTSPSSVMRSTVITAIKFTIIDQPQPIDLLLKQCLHLFLQPLVDTDLNVRRVTLAMFNSVAHNKPGLIRDLLVNLLPHLYNETKIRKELIREVEMGPFKHTVDDGLDIRKAAFECMYTLIDSCLDRVDIFEFLNHVEDGLKDHYDIKILTYLMIVRLSTLCPIAVLQHLDRIIEPLRSTVQAKVKANSVKQEYEKQDELKRSVLRAVVALKNIPDSDLNPMFADFISQIRSNPETSMMLDSVQTDSNIISSSESMDNL